MPAALQTAADELGKTGPVQVLVLPGWQGSGPGHWQSRWERTHGYTRVEQHDWERPLRGDWTARLEEVLLDLPGAPVVLAAHSLGCLLVAAWAAHSRHTARVAGALLVAPPDVSTPALQPALASWASVPLQRLPFPSVLVASQDDPFCSLPRSGELAQAWGADWVNAGCAGHLNADSGLGDWPEGHAHLLTLLARTDRQLA
jgi:predicted alpha/beta hydrolase family esterase